MKQFGMLSAAPIVSVGYSVLGRRGLDFEDNVFEVARLPGVEVVVVWQKFVGDEAVIARYESRGIRIFPSQRQGLSVSRNDVFREAKGEYIWFQDGDTKIEVTALDGICRLLRETQFDAILVQIGCLEDRSKFYKNYDRPSVLPILSALRVSSIEIIVRKAFCIAHNISFREDLGLGTEEPCGEEVDFMMQLIRTGGRVEQYKRPAVFHSCSEGSRFRQGFSHFVAKGRLLRQLGVFLGLLVGFSWWARRNEGLCRCEKMRAMREGWRREAARLRTGSA